MSAYEGTDDEKLRNTHPLYSFLYDFRDITPDNIKNEVLRTSPAFRKKTEDYRNIYKSVLMKFNKKYAMQRLEELPENERKKTIILNGRKMSLEAFVSNYVLPRMDTHQKTRIGTKKYSLSEIIYYFKAEGKNPEPDDMLEEHNNENIQTIHK